MSQAIDLSSLSGAGSAELERLQTALKASGDEIYEWDIATDAISWSANVKKSLGLARSAQDPGGRQARESATDDHDAHHRAEG